MSHDNVSKANYIYYQVLSLIYFLLVSIRLQALSLNLAGTCQKEKCVPKSKTTHNYRSTQFTLQATKDNTHVV